MQIQTIPVEQAVGKVLSHDVTRIAKDEFKGPLLRKGHIINADDVHGLKQAGKEHIFILELREDELHEDEAGIRLGRAAAGSGVHLIGPTEGRVNLVADRQGLLRVKTGLLEQVNALPDVVLATLPSLRLVAANEVVAGTRVIPLAVPLSRVSAAEEILRGEGLVSVTPLIRKRVGLVITGEEVYSGRIADAFAPVLREKLQSLGSVVQAVDFAPDEASHIARVITKHANDGAELILVTGGMSVDPDDVTPAAVRMAGAEVVQYGAPVLPGAMFMMAYLQDVPLLGVPACGMFFRTTVLDLILPRILAGDRITRRDIIGLAHGGLCRSCQPCHYPACSFGVGGA